MHSLGHGKQLTAADLAVAMFTNLSLHVEHQSRASADKESPCLGHQVSEQHASYLPFEVVVAVLQRVPQQQRLTACACVSRTWAAAAVAASSNLKLSLTNIPAAARYERAAGFSNWLQQHAALQSLQFQGNYMSRPRLQLPADCLQRLQHLVLTNCRAAFATTVARPSARNSTNGSRTGHNSTTSSRPQQHPPAGPEEHTQGIGSVSIPRGRSSRVTSTPASAPGPTAAALQALQLQGCVLEWGPGLPCAVSLSNLLQLNLQQLLPGELSKDQQASFQQIVPAAFQQMTQLTQLVLKQLNQYESVLLAGLAAGLGGMRHLLELQVDMLQLTAPALTDLPSSITLLELAGAKQLVLSASALPSLARLTDLQELFVEGVRRFEPRLLHNMPKLRSLRVRSSSSRFLPDGTLGTQDLLAALRGLTNLQTLGLRNVLQHLLDDRQAQLYSGLTGSSLLQQLDLSACRFPPESGQAVVHGACSLLHLQRLVLYRCEDPPGSVLLIEDLNSLVDSCPALEDLALWLRLPSSSSSSSQAGGTVVSSSSGGSSSSTHAAAAGQQLQLQLQLEPLLGLSGLTRLVIAGPGVTCGELAAVAQLRGLESLAMYRCSPLNDMALLQLTQLNGLTALAIDAHSCVTKWLGVSEYLYLQGPAGHRVASGGNQSVMSSPAGTGVTSVLSGSSGAEDARASVTSALSSSPVDGSKGIARAIMAVRRELPVWQQLRRLLLTGSLLGDA